MTHELTPLRTYFIIYLILLALLALTVAIAYVDLGPWGIVVALIIAIVKALLVMFYFMHLRSTNPLVWLFAGAGFVWLGILFFYSISDYLSRGWVGS